MPARHKMSHNKKIIHKIDLIPDCSFVLWSLSCLTIFLTARVFLICSTWFVQVTHHLSLLFWKFFVLSQGGGWQKGSTCNIYKIDQEDKEKGNDRVPGNREKINIIQLVFLMNDSYNIPRGFDDHFSTQILNGKFYY